MKKNIILFALLFVGVLTGYCQQSAYLFVYFTGNRMSEEAVKANDIPKIPKKYLYNRFIFIVFYI